MGRKSRQKRQRRGQTRRKMPDKNTVEKHRPPPTQVNPKPVSQGSFEFYTESSLSVNSPYPPPDWVEAYERAVPGMGQEIVDGVREQRKHRFSMERWALANSVIAGYIGQVSAFILGGGAIYLGYQLILDDKNVTGFGTILVSVGALAGVYLVGKRNQQRKLSPREKQKEIENPEG